MKGETILIWLSVGVFVFSIIMLVSGIFSTGYATSASTSSNVTISTYYSINASSNLSTGILFGTVTSAAVTDLNATGNYGGSSLTQYNITVSADSNTNVSFNISANAGLTSSGGDVIGLGNETYANHTTNSAALPAVGSQVALTTGQVTAGSNIGIGSANQYRFWLDIPAGQATGSYNNTITFTGYPA
jgi:hypothetical protein